MVPRISIHAPRMGSDACPSHTLPASANFNPRSPDGERQVNLGRIVTGGEFQSTLPGWGATFPSWRGDHHRQDFNPRSPDGERRFQIVRTSECFAYFNPRSPDGERRYHRHAVRRVRQISIHAPRMGSDRRNYARHGCGLDFNPRSPDGERLRYRCGMLKRSLFQSTLPGWGATS